MNSLSGEVVVAGLVTGTHIIEDIGVAVPHQIAVHIPAEQALRSKDLWRGIQQRKLFKLDGGSGLHMAARPASADDHRIAELEAENAKLRQELDTERNRSQGLLDMMAGLQAQYQGIQAALGKLGDLPRVIQMVSSPGAAPAVSRANPEVVGGAVPTFLPEHIRPEIAETQIRPAVATTEGSNVAASTSKLRELKKQSSNG